MTTPGKRPGRLLWVVNHVPTWTIRVGLGRLLGERLAMVVHRGRKTGQPRTVIVELADGSVAQRRLVFVAAYGERAQWIRNLRQAPPIRIVVAGRTYEAPRLEFLSPDQTADAVASYWRRYPHVARFLAGQGLYPSPGYAPDAPGAPVGIVFHL